ncbi:toll/interleukin-1 receptor domain-containing protein [Pseudomonas brassicacearum]
MSKVFLSHNHADKPFTRRLANDLRQAGHSVWIDEAEINIGDSLIGKIREGLDEVDFVAAVLSEHSIGSVWVQRELEIASNREIEERRVVVLPLLVQKVALPGFLKGKFYADFTDPSSYKPMLDLLLRALGPATPVESPQKLRWKL